jgi:hypothetical protein
MRFRLTLARFSHRANIQQPPNNAVLLLPVTVDAAILANDYTADTCTSTCLLKPGYNSSRLQEAPTLTAALSDPRAMNRIFFLLRSLLTKHD